MRDGKMIISIKLSLMEAERYHLQLAKATKT